MYKKNLIDTIVALSKPDTDDSTERTEYLKNESISALEDRIASKNIQLDNEVISFAKYRGNNCSVPLLDSIKFLTMVLKEFFGERCYVIIDEYDAPINGSLGAPAHDFIVHNISKMFTAGFKKKNFVTKAIMTGVLNFAAVSPFSGMNLFPEYSLEVPGKYSTFFGFTEAEVEYFLTENVQPYDEKLKKR